MLKRISLISQSSFVSERHFACINYQNRDTVALVITESELVKNSTHITAYNKDCQPFDRSSATYNGMSVVTHYLTNNGYLVVDKGVIGTDTAIFISKISIKEEANQFVVTVTIVDDDTVADSVYRAYKLYDVNVNTYLQENLLHKLRYSFSPVPMLLDRIEHTRFLDCSETNYIPVPVLLLSDGSYVLNEESTNYRPADGLRTVAPGSQLYLEYPGDVLEIIKVVDFSHSVYGDFYGMAEVLSLFCQQLSEKKQSTRLCSKGMDINTGLINLLNQAEGVLEPPVRTNIGARVIFQELLARPGTYGIKADMFQFAIREKPLKMGTYQPASGDLITVGLGSLVGSLLMTGESMKVLLYKATGVITHDGRFYLRFDYDSETALFRDFVQAGMDLFMPAKHTTACRMAEYLMLTNNLMPIQFGHQ